MHREPDPLRYERRSEALFLAVDLMSRWNEGRRGQTLPSRFETLAEETLAVAERFERWLEGS